MIGYGFMGRAHSNAYRKVNNFFDLEYRPGPQGRLRPRRGEGQGVRRQVGLRVDRDRLAEAARAQGHRRRRHLHAEQPARGDRHRRRQGRQDDPLRKAAGDERRRRRRDVPRPSRRPACRTWSGTTTAACPPSRSPSNSSTKASSAASSTTAPTSCRTGRSPPICRKAARASGGSTSPPPAAASPATCSPTASTPPSGSTAAIANVSAMTETFIKERKHNLTGKVEKVGIDDACAFLCRFANGSLGLFESTRYARGHKALYTFEINGENASIKWDLHDLHRLQYFDHRDEGPLRGWRSDPRHRRRSSLHGQLVGARPADRLRALLRASGRRLPRQTWRRTNPPARPSATRWKRKKSATPCSPAPAPANG